MFEFISTSDWHLEGLDNHFPTDGVQRQLETIDRIYQYAVEQGIKTVMIVGDITDKHRMRDDTKKLLLQHFVKYDEVVQSIYIGGNHDWQDQTATSMDLINQISEWGMLKNLKVYLRPEQVVLDGIVCNMMPYPTPPTMKNKKPCLNFVHVETKGALGDNGRPLRTNAEFACPKKDYTISGHIHKYQHLVAQRFLYNGAPYQKTYGEDEIKGFCHVKASYVKGKLVVKHKFVDTKPTFRLRTMFVNKQEQWADLEVNPALRYRVYASEDVTVPTDIRTRVPNISQLITDRKAGTVDFEKLDVAELEAIEVDVKDGLKQYLRTSGLKPKQQKAGIAEIDSILEELGM